MKLSYNNILFIFQLLDLSVKEFLIRSKRHSILIANIASLI